MGDREQKETSDRECTGLTDGLFMQQYCVHSGALPGLSVRLVERVERSQGWGPVYGLPWLEKHKILQMWALERVTHFPVAKPSSSVTLSSGRHRLAWWGTCAYKHLPQTTCLAFLAFLPLRCEVKLPWLGSGHPFLLYSKGVMPMYA